MSAGPDMASDIDALLRHYQRLCEDREQHIERLLTRLETASADALARVQDYARLLQTVSAERETWVGHRNQLQEDLRRLAAERDDFRARIEALEAEGKRLASELHDAVAKAAGLTDAVSQRDAMVDRLRADVRYLRHDLLVKEGYLIELRRTLSEAETAPAAEDSHAPIESEAGSPATSGPAEPPPVLPDPGPAIAPEVVADLEKALAEARDALAESRREIAGYQRTLALPRYRAADRVNRLARLTGPLHGLLKRLLP